MTVKNCPVKKHCFDKGNCEGCAFGKAITNLSKKSERLKLQNEALKKENEALKERINTLLHPDF